MACAESMLVVEGILSRERNWRRVALGLLAVPEISYCGLVVVDSHLRASGWCPGAGICL